MTDSAYANVRIPVSSEQLNPWQGQRSGAALLLSGPCPACGHETRAQVSGSLDALETLEGLHATSLTVSLACDCGVDHAGRPEGATGCGRRWAAVADITANGRARLQPSADARLEVAAEARRVAGTGGLERLRTAAEKWIAGISALLGLVTVTGLSLAADPIRKLGVGGRVAVAAVVALAVAAAAIAITQAYRAAYGWPERRAVTDDAGLLAWDDAQQHLPRITGERLRNAARAAGVALGALVVAAGLTWFLPAAKPPAPLVKATMRDDSTVCGTLLGSTADGQLRLRRADDGAVAALAGGEVRRLTPVARC